MPTRAIAGTVTRFRSSRKPRALLDFLEVAAGGDVADDESATWTAIGAKVTCGLLPESVADPTTS